MIINIHVVKFSMQHANRVVFCFRTLAYVDQTGVSWIEC